MGWEGGGKRKERGDSNVQLGLVRSCSQVLLCFAADVWWVDPITLTLWQVCFGGGRGGREGMGGEGGRGEGGRGGEREGGEREGGNGRDGGWEGGWVGEWDGREGEREKREETVMFSWVL